MTSNFIDESVKIEKHEDDGTAVSVKPNTHVFKFNEHIEILCARQLNAKYFTIGFRNSMKQGYHLFKKVNGAFGSVSGNALFNSVSIDASGTITARCHTGKTIRIESAAPAAPVSFAINGEALQAAADKTATVEIHAIEQIKNEIKILEDTLTGPVIIDDTTAKNLAPKIRELKKMKARLAEMLNGSTAIHIRS